MTTQTAAIPREVEIIKSFTRSLKEGAGKESLLSVKEASIKRFGELGFPKRKHEMFTYADTRELALTQFATSDVPSAAGLAGQLKGHTLAGCERSVLVVVDGYFSPTLSNIAGVSDHVVVTTLGIAAKTGPVLAMLEKYAAVETDVFATLNGAFFHDGVAIRIKPRAKLSAPLQVVVISSGANDVPPASYPRIFVDAGESSESSVIVKYAGFGGAYFVNAREDVIAREGASLHYAVIQADGPESWNMTKLAVELGANARFNHTMAFNGGRIARRNIEARLKGEGAKIEISGASALAGKEQSHIYARVYHEAPDCESSQLFRNVVTGESKNSVDTTVIVGEAASGSVSRQLVNALVLSNGARADAKPNLMIYNDDVKCSHGATAGGVNDDQLFYMTTRGVARRDAQRALVAAFLRSVTSLMPTPASVETAEELVVRKMEMEK
jgi:Fe-S cluster assembly protein SufD